MKLVIFIIIFAIVGIVAYALLLQDGFAHTIKTIKNKLKNRTVADNPCKGNGRIEKPHPMRITEDEYRGLLSLLHTVEQMCTGNIDLTRDFESLRQELSDLRVSCRSLSQGLSVVKTSLDALNAELSAPRDTPASDSDIPPVDTYPSVSYPICKYAFLTDIQHPDCFPCESLSDDSNDMVYEITINDPKHATFRLLPDPDMQQGLLNIIGSKTLSSTCEFNNYPPGYVSGLENVNAGELMLQDGVWIITKKITLKYV